MSPIWKVTVDECDYDEYDAFVVRAESEERALGVANKHFTPYQRKHGFKATPIPEDGPEEEILGSFNAG